MHLVIGLLMLFIFLFDYIHTFWNKIFPKSRKTKEKNPQTFILKCVSQPWSLPPLSRPRFILCFAAPLPRSGLRGMGKKTRTGTGRRTILQLSPPGPRSGTGAGREELGSGSEGKEKCTFIFSFTFLVERPRKSTETSASPRPDSHSHLTVSALNGQTGQ